MTSSNGASANGQNQPVEREEFRLEAILGGIRRGLLAEGFNEEQAFELTREAMDYLLDRNPIVVRDQSAWLVGFQGGAA